MNRKRIYRIMVALATVMALSACSAMQEDRSDCPTCKNPLRIKLRYDYNLQRADMFNDHVGAAVCYVVDGSNRIVAKQYAANRDGNEPLKESSFAFNFEGLAAGNYTAYAVGAQRDFSELTNFLPTDLDEGDDITGLLLRIPHATAADADGRYAVDASQPLDTIWHGVSAEPVVVEAKSPTEYTVGLVRDTKNLSIMLVQTQNPTENYAENYEVRVADHNTLLDYQNLLANDEALRYDPYDAWTTETLDNTNTLVERVAHYDLSFGRLFSYDQSGKNARLLINNRADGAAIVDIDLVYYLSLARNAAENRYGIQEYLDRAYDYRLDFVLVGNEWKYMTISIDVLNWSLRIERTTL
ncbi:MAG: FimB/Mfa2 family fimbrial subunit [Prevotella sp.]|nr:FimB/Mfa2 family fimbrial subunit [Prevotella sp.]